MKVAIEDSIQQDPRLSSAISRAQETLAEELGPSAESVTAFWGLERDDRGRPLVILRLSDFTGSAQDRFSLEEFDDSWRLRTRLHRLWGDLLQDRSDKQVAALQQLIGQSAGD